MRKLLDILLFAVILMFSTTLKAQTFVENSVLKDGTIYKIGVVEDGVYRITYDELTAAGVDVNSLNRDKISLFGNVRGMLPEANDEAAYDDLTEMDIMVDDNGILFYGEGSCEWTASGNYFKYGTNYYSDTTFYFLKIDNQNNGKRMETQPQDLGDPQSVINTFVDRQYHEIDLHNHYHRGRKWFGETVNIEDGALTIPFVFKNVITDFSGYLEVCFVGATAVVGTTARLKVDGEQVIDDISIAKAGQYNFAEEKTVSAYYYPVSDTVEVSLEVNSTNVSSYLGLDYICINACRSLRYEDEQLQFSMNRGSHVKLETINVENVGNGAVVLDVSTPLSPKIQEFSLTGNVVGFNRMLAGLNTFVVFEDSDIKNVVSIKSIDNQNVHSISYAEMLIITDKIFAEQAEAIKTIHEEDEGLVSEVVFVDEIYNEFSSGSLDVTAVRNFVRMVYDRTPDLKYLLLLGRGTNDYKNAEGYGCNFVPTYEALNSVNEINAYLTDDYFGLLDPDEGYLCEGKVDIGVGRIPVLTPDEAAGVVSKIVRYMDAAKSFGRWRNEMLILADDKRDYARNSDEFETLVESKNTTLNIDKIYADAYVRQKLSDGSYCYPDVTSSIVNKFNEGIFLMTYLGHGGVKGLSGSNIFRIKDIETLENYNKLPFVVTGTCEFSAFDDASFVSAGEILFKMEKGGAIGMYTTTRPTNATINKNMLKVFLDNALSGDNIRTLTMGDIIRNSKRENINNSSNYLSYVFFGDPALRFVYPEKNIVINKINGHSPTDITVAPMDMVSVEGWVTDENGAVDTDFNGVIYAKMFDNKSRYTTLNNQNISGNVYAFTNYSDVSYEGGFSVANGRFSCIFPVPRSVNNQNANAKLSFYAMDTLNRADANGFYKSIVVEGNPSVLPDIEGPEIKLSYHEGHLSAQLHDPQGIYHTSSVIGRDLMLQIESRYSSKTLIVNDYYEQTIDDFTSGNLEVDLEPLDEGENKISLRAWDTHDNGNTASIVVNIVNNEVVKSMRNVTNYPNPFSESTCITIEYDRKDVTVDINVDIYDITGRVVNSLKYNDLNAYDIKLDWDGLDASGRRLPTGVYIYKVYLKDSDGNESSTSQRMIIL